MSLSTPLFVGWLILIPLDVFRFQWAVRPGVLASVVGLVLVFGGLWVMFLSLKTNPFAARVVKTQEGRGQVVIDTGVYSVVRHPMYAGGIPFVIGTVLWLESYVAAVLAIVPAGVLAVRILIEERFLEREHVGYTTYKQRVRFRLVPHVW